MIHQFAQHYHFGGGLMSYTIQDHVRDFTREHLHELPPEERLKDIPLEILEEYLRQRKRQQS